MRTITAEEFFKHFMKISQELTYAEIQLLYLIITKPEVIELPQQSLAEKLSVHRRTINIGIKKLRELNYIREDIIHVDEEASSKKTSSNLSAIHRHEISTAKHIIENSIENYYKVNNKTFTINEDYFSFIIGDMRLPSKYRHNEDFIVDTIRGKFPSINFYFELNVSDYNSENHYRLIYSVNSEIAKAREKKVYRINFQNTLREQCDSMSINIDEGQKLIREAFPKIRLSNKYISLRRPYDAVDLTF
ncbi:MAG: HTH domain-containing protein [Bacteroidales bacterium]|nr:HTH domain-containing protein [Bacteroidales bacterium]